VTTMAGERRDQGEWRVAGNPANAIARSVRGKFRYRPVTKFYQILRIFRDGHYLPNVLPYRAATQ
jgi:hypothetical protein